MENEVIYYLDSRRADKNLIVYLAGITYPDPTYMIDRECSDCYVFEYVLSGRGVINIDGKVYNVKKDDVYILKKGSRHTYYSDKKEPMKKIWFNTDGDIITHLLNDYCLTDTVCVEGFGDSSMFFKIRSHLLECIEKQTLHGSEVDVLFHMLIGDLADFEKKKNRQKGEAEILKEYIDSHLDRNITINELSGIIYRSVSHTINIFKKSTGKTPYDYMLERKIETAKMLLKNTNMKINDICIRSGFSDSHYFSRYFKKSTGETPGEYRKKYR